MTNICLWNVIDRNENYHLVKNDKSIDDNELAAYVWSYKILDYFSDYKSRDSQNSKNDL